MTRYVIGVDPGLSGAVAILYDATRHIIDIHDMPTADGAVACALLAGLLRDRASATVEAHLELPHAMPGQGVSTTWKFARSVGAIEGVLAGLAIPTLHHTPAKWKGAMRLSKDKGASRAMAARLWPGDAHRFARVKDDGRAEAALIALYGTGWRP